MWRIEYARAAQRDTAGLDAPIAKRIRSFPEKRLAQLDNPRDLGELLHGARLGEFWKYRVGDYRLIVRIEDDALCVLVVRIGHRRAIYREAPRRH